ncbi:MAG: hypothetical protein QOG82_2894 [Actinomycetota bacterium]|nr:hypothetical protein [Actinomycetota bacterium]
MSTDATDPTKPGHPDFETLSAHFDGEAPEVAAHVASCAECRTTLKWLRTATSLVATPVPPAPASVRDQTIARAADVFQRQPKIAKGLGGRAEATGAAGAVGGPVSGGPVAGAGGAGGRPVSGGPGSVGAGGADGPVTGGSGRRGAGGVVGGPVAGGPDPVGAEGASVSPTVRPPTSSRPAATGRSFPSPRPSESEPRPADSGRTAGAPVPITAGRRNRARGGSGLWVGLGSAAAVIVAVLVGVSAIGGGSGRDDTDTVAAGQSQERSTTLFAGDSAGGAATAGVPDADTSGGVNAGDLGQIPDAATLVARARPVLTQRQAALAAPVAPVAGAGQESRAPDLTDIVPKAVGTRPCELEARTARPGLGTVVYFATGQVEGVPVVVLGFDPGLPPADITLLALAQQEGCRVVLEAAGP